MEITAVEDTTLVSEPEQVGVVVQVLWDLLVVQTIPDRLDVEVLADNTI